MKLERPIHLRSSAIDTFAVWRKQDKKNFTQDEIGVSLEELKDRIAVSDPGLNFEINKGFSIAADSFRFCAKNRSIVTSVIGGEHLTISLFFEDGSALHTNLYSSDLFERDFKIEQYISSYIFFKETLPKAFPYHEHFTRNRFLDAILYYHKTVECEGYYFIEYAESVGLKGIDRRKRVGWNFKDYLTNRPTTK